MRFAYSALRLNPKIVAARKAANMDPNPTETVMPARNHAMAYLSFNAQTWMYVPTPLANEATPVMYAICIGLLNGFSVQFGRRHVLLREVTAQTISAIIIQPTVANTARNPPIINKFERVFHEKTIS